MKKLIKKILLWWNPPKVGDIYYGDCFDFVVGYSIEKVLHGITDRYGNALWDCIPGEGSYRLKILSASMPYYRCEVEVLLFSKNNVNNKKWSKRSQDRRLAKEMFHDMILTDQIKKI